MACGCGGSASKAAVMSTVQTYEIQGDPEGIKYLTERDAIDQRIIRGLTGAVVPSR